MAIWSVAYYNDADEFNHACPHRRGVVKAATENIARRHVEAEMHGAYRVDLTPHFVPDESRFADGYRDLTSNS